MAALTNQQIRDYTRTYLQADSTDLPDALIDMWVREAQLVILKSRPLWPHLFATDDITTVVDQADYEVALDRIRDIQGSDYNLQEIDVVYGDSIFTPNVVDAGQVRYFARVERAPDTSFWTVRIYPTPQAVESLIARGARIPDDPAASSTSTLDLPDEFIPLATQFVTARACFQQNDYEQGQLLQSQFEASLGILKSNLVAETPEPFVLNRPRQRPYLFPDPRFPFEPPWSNR